jgi:hypothetical protein
MTACEVRVWHVHRRERRGRTYNDEVQEAHTIVGEVRVLCT